MNNVTFVLSVTLGVVMILLHSSYSFASDRSVDQIEQLREQFLPAEYRNNNITLDDAKRFLREKCKKASGTENANLYQDIESGAEKLMECISSLANITALQEEMEWARPLGELDTVFHKYCSRVPEAQQCLRNFSAQLQPCLTAEEQKQNVVILRVLNGLIDYMCHKGGDQIALFIAEEGPECLEANREAISGCLNASFAEYLPKDVSIPNAFELPALLLTTKHCIDMERFENCTVYHLEQCHEVTPANIAESVFRYIKKETNCKAMIEAKRSERPVLRPRESKSSGVATTRISVVHAVTVLTMMMMMMAIPFKF